MKNEARVLLYLEAEDLLPRKLYSFEKLACLSIHRGGVPANDEGRTENIVRAAYDELKADDRLPPPGPTPEYGRECFCCGVGMEPEFKDGLPRTLPLANPNGGTIWESTGNYGSTVWDPIGPSDVALHIVVCDQCLKERSAKVRFVKRNRMIEVLEQRPWNKETD